MFQCFRYVVCKTFGLHNSKPREEPRNVLTEVGMFALRSLCCRCKRNDVTPRSKAQRNHDALINPEEEDVSALALQITRH